MVTRRTPGCPDIASGPRLTVKVSLALDSNFDTGFCGVPLRFRGACASSASRIALSAIAAGASTTDVPVNGCNGGIATSAGRLACDTDGLTGHSTFISSVAPMNDPARTSTPRRMVRSRLSNRFPPTRY